MSFWTDHTPDFLFGARQARRSENTRYKEAPIIPNPLVSGRRPRWATGTTKMCLSFMKINPALSCYVL